MSTAWYMLMQEGDVWYLADKEQTLEEFIDECKRRKTPPGKKRTIAEAIKVTVFHKDEAKHALLCTHQGQLAMFYVLIPRKEKKRILYDGVASMRKHGTQWEYGFLEGDDLTVLNATGALEKT